MSPTFYTKRQVLDAASKSKDFLVKDGVLWIVCNAEDNFQSRLNVESYPISRELLSSTLGSQLFSSLSPHLDANPTRPTSEETPVDIVASTIAERGLVYGDPYESHRNIGKSWTALLQQHYGITLPHDVSASLVAQMMVVFKMQRSAKVFKDDNYIDAHAYTQFAEEFQKKEQEK